MKKILFTFVMLLVGMTSFAQQGATWVGVNVNYGMHSDYKNFGLGAKVQYEFVDNWRAEVAGNYFFEKDNVSMWDANLNLHYLIHAGSLTIYPLAGFTLLGTSVDLGPLGSHSDSDFGFNVGAGIEFPISSGIKLNIEGKYQYVNDWDRPVFSAGLAFAL